MHLQHGEHRGLPASRFFAYAAGWMRKKTFLERTGLCITSAVLGAQACSPSETVASSSTDAGDLDAAADVSLDDASSVADSAAPGCGDARWATDFGPAADGAADYAQSFAVALDPMGNVLLTGTYLGVVDIGGGTPPSGSSAAMFVVKLDATGKDAWSKGFVDLDDGAMPAPSVQGYAIATDAKADVVVGGVLAGAADLGGGILTSAGGSSSDAGTDAASGGCGMSSTTCTADALIAKYDASGAHLWSHLFGGAGNDSVRAVAFDAQGNLFASGTFEGTVDFGGPPLVSAGQSDGWVAKLDPQGHHLWSVRIGGTGADAAIALAVDSKGNVVTTGVFADSVAFGATSLTSAGSFDGFVAKLDASDGHVLWAKQANTSARASMQRVAVGKRDEVAVVGIYQGSIDGGMGVMKAVSGWDDFVAKLDSDGNVLWLKSYGSDGDDRGSGIAVDAEGRVVVAGQVKSQHGIDFGGGPLGAGDDMSGFVVVLDPTSRFLCGRSIGGSSVVSDVAADPQGVVVTGSFSGQIDFGLGTVMGSSVQSVFVGAFGP
jgi:hypothetical protein